MKDQLFNTESKIKAAIAGFTNLLNYAGWKLLEQVIDANIEVVTDLILTGRNLEGEEATEEEMDRLRDKLKVYKEVKNTPRRMIDRLSSGEEPLEPTVDPYQTREQLEEERKKT